MSSQGDEKQSKEEESTFTPTIDNKGLEKLPGVYNVTCKNAVNAKALFDLFGAEGSINKIQDSTDYTFIVNKDKLKEAGITDPNNPPKFKFFSSYEFYPKVNILKDANACEIYVDSIAQLNAVNKYCFRHGIKLDLPQYTNTKSVQLQPVKNEIGRITGYKYNITGNAFKDNKGRLETIEAVFSGKIKEKRLTLTATNEARILEEPSLSQKQKQQQQQQQQKSTSSSADFKAPQEYTTSAAADSSSYTSPAAPAKKATAAATQSQPGKPATGFVLTQADLSRGRLRSTGGQAPAKTSGPAAKTAAPSQSSTQQTPTNPLGRKTPGK